MEIVSVTATVLRASWNEVFAGVGEVPASMLRPAASFATFPRTGQYSTIVEVTADSGAVGIGECYGLPDPSANAALVNELFAPALVGTDAYATEIAWRRMMELPKAMGLTRGIVMQAISGIDMAMWDLKAKLLGLPLVSLLGGDPTRSIRCYASPVPFLPHPDESAAAAVRFVEQGFGAIKLKIGRGERTDLVHIAAVRDAIGADIDLLLDCNCAYRVSEAISLARRLEPYDISWLEEPIPPEDVAALADLRSRIGLRIAVGENEFTALGVREIVASRAADVLMPNLSRCGVTGALQIATLTDVYGLVVAPHGVGSAVNLAATLHYLGAIPNGLLYEFNRMPNPLRDDLARLPELADGALSIPSGDGLGLAFDPAVRARYSLPS